MPKDETPADLDGIDPLYRAMYHGCLAHRYAAALDIYWTRISRGRDFFSQKELGAFSLDLAAIAAFFPDGWDEPVLDGLTEEQRAFLLALASFELTALGRPTEALRPRNTEIAMFEALGDWRLVSGDLRNLVQILLPLGRLAEALRASERAITAARRLESSWADGTYSGGLDDRYLLVSAVTRQATVLHRMGQMERAHAGFEEAERVYGSTLDRVNGFYFGLLLTDLATDDSAAADVVQRGEQNLRSATDRRNIGDIGNSHVTLARAFRSQGDEQQAAHHADAAVTIFRQAYRLDRLPYGLLERARLHRSCWLRNGQSQDLQRCVSDVDEADELISFSNMALYGVDRDILRAHLLIDHRELGEAHELVEAGVRAGIERTGYRLRMADLAALEARLRAEGEGEHA